MAKRDRFKYQNTLPLVSPKSHCHRRASKGSNLPRGKGDPEGETRHARACAYVRETACTKEPRAMWLERRARAPVATLYRLCPAGFAVVSAITTGCEIGRFRSGGIEAASPSVPPTQILVEYLFARSRAPLVPRECFPTLLRGYFFDKHWRLSRCWSDMKSLNLFLEISWFGISAKRATLVTLNEKLLFFFPKFVYQILIDINKLIN